MKKQLFIVALTVLAVPAVLLAPAGGRRSPVNVNGDTGAAKPAGVTSTTVTSAAGLVAAFPGQEADLVAGAIAGSGVTPGSATSAAGQAAAQFVQKGSAQVNASGAQSKALGRLGK